LVAVTAVFANNDYKQNIISLKGELLWA
jgi:hypothetical protein